MATPLKNLRDHHYAAIRMKIEGFSGREIAQALNTTVRQVYLWFGDPLVKAELEAQRIRIFDRFAERITDLSMRALQKLEQLADLDLDDSTVSVEQKLEILREILDRNPVTAKRSNSGGYSADAPPPSLSDEELIERFRQVAGELPSGVIDGVAVDANGANR